MPLLLSEADVRSVLGMPDLIDAMQSVLAEFSTGATQQPLRTVLQIGEAKSFFGHHNRSILSVKSSVR